MAVYYCDPCGNFKDDDVDVGEETSKGFICPDCNEKYFDEDGKEIEE